MRIYPAFPQSFLFWAAIASFPVYEYILHLKVSSENVIYYYELNSVAVYFYLYLTNMLYPFKEIFASELFHLNTMYILLYLVGNVNR